MTQQQFLEKTIRDIFGDLLLENARLQSQIHSMQQQIAELKTAATPSKD